MPIQRNNKAKAAYSLRLRLTSAMAAGFMLILSILSIALWNYAISAANKTYDLLLEGSAISILGRVSSNDDGISVDFPPSALEMLGLAEYDRVFYHIFTADGKTITGDPNLPLPPSQTDPVSAVYFDDNYTQAPVRFVTQGKYVAGADAPQLVFVQVGQTYIGRDNHKNDLFYRGMLLLGILAVAGVLFARVAINIALKPLSGIVADIESREPSDLRALKASPPREIAGLISAINGFMRRLDTSKDNAQIFIADVAHQMRTSLSALKGQLEFADEQSSPEALKEHVGKANTQARKTIDLTNQLLAHAMVIHRADAQVKSKVNLVDLISDAIEEHIRQGTGTDLEFEFGQNSAKKDLNITGDAILLREALRNLINNVEVHAGKGSSIHFSVEETGSGNEYITLIVEDNGPGIAPDQRETAMERFSKHGDTAGSGLGLAIIKASIDAHHGQVNLSERIGGGLRVEILLPKSTGGSLA